MAKIRGNLSGEGMSVYCVDMVSKVPLSVSHPELAPEALGWDPATVSAGSNRKMLWRCAFGHEWEALVSNRSRGRGCRECSNVQNGENRKGKALNTMQFLIQTHPQIASEIVGLTDSKIRKVKTQSRIKLIWLCSQGHEYPNSPSNRAHGQGCPFCSGRKVLKGFNDLATTHPKLATEAHGWDPTEVSFGMGKRLEWQCPEMHIYPAILNLRSSQSTDCPYCTGKKILVGFNDLATTFPELAKEAFGWDPKTVTFGSNKRVMWKCSNGHKWQTQLNSRTPSSKWQPSRKTQSLSGNEAQNNLVSDDSAVAHSRIDDLLKKIHNLVRTDEPADESSIPTTSYFPVVESELEDEFSSLGSGCPSCAKYGFDPNSDGWLYLLIHPDWQMLQIGITNFPVNRLENHKRLGWEIVELRGPMDGLIARVWETSILRMLRRVGADLSNAHVAGKFDGYSEAWSNSTFQVKTIQELMRLTEEFESLSPE